jgi:hypothetical protein
VPALRPHPFTSPHHLTTCSRLLDLDTDRTAQCQALGRDAVALGWLSEDARADAF